MHTFLGVLYAGWRRPDILHIHAVGPAIMTPLARMLGLRVVVTHHGPDYDREKWGSFARAVLRLGERFGMRFASQRIVISQVIGNIVWEKYRCDSFFIPNGVILPSVPDTKVALQMFSLQSGKYVLMVGRMVPEKRHLDLIAAFASARPAGWKLVLVGGGGRTDQYMETVRRHSRVIPYVVLAGFQSGRILQELYANAGMFVLPSSHEGLPIALLEALSYGLPVLASDIPANLEVGLPRDHYFELGNRDELANKILTFSSREVDRQMRDKLKGFIASRYCWDNVASETVSAYQAALAGC